MRYAALALALTLAQSVPTLAADPAEGPVEVRYDVFWGGFHAAEAQLIRTQGDSRLAVHATGMMENLSAFVLEAEARRSQFSSRASSRRMVSLLEVDFTGTPRTVIDQIRLANGAEDDESDPRPPVPEEMKAGTLDPLNALTETSARALSAAPGSRFTVPVFDGRNRYDVTVEVTAPAAARITFKPLAGFRPRSFEMWQDASFIVRLDPATGLPSRVASESFTVATVISAVPPVRRTGG